MPYQFVYYLFDQGKLTTPPPHPITTFTQLLPPELHCCLEGKDPYGIPATVAAVGVLEGTLPIGMAVASFTPGNKEFDIHTLNLLSPHNTLSLGVELLRHIEQEGKSLGARYFFLTFPAEEPLYEEIIKENKWRGINPFMVTCHYYMPTLNMPWIHSNFAYQEGVEEFLWTELRESERQQILHDQNNDLFTSSVSPFFEEEQLEPVNSLGIRYQGRVVAWMVTHRVNADTIKYRALYVEKGLESLTLGPKLVAHAILRHLDSKILWSTFEIPLLQVNSSWKRFVEKRLVPYADKVERQRLAWNV